MRPWILTLAITLSNTYAHAKIKNVVFDLHGVLLTIDKQAAASNVSKTSAICMMLYNMRIPNHGDVFDLLKDVPAVSKDHAYTCNMRMPQILVDWQTGAQSNFKILHATRTQLAKENLYDFQKEFALSVVGGLMNPELLEEAVSVIPESGRLLEELKAKGNFNLYVLSNWDKVSFPRIEEKLKSLFDNFDGQVISGYVGMLKPNRDIFDFLLFRYGLDASETLFIDDELANVIAANTLGIQTVHFQGPQAYDEIWGLLGEKPRLR